MVFIIFIQFFNLLILNLETVTSLCVATLDFYDGFTGGDIDPNQIPVELYHTSLYGTSYFTPRFDCYRLINSNDVLSVHCPQIPGCPPLRSTPFRDSIHDSEYLLCVPHSPYTIPQRLENVTSFTFRISKPITSEYGVSISVSPITEYFVAVTSGAFENSGPEQPIYLYPNFCRTYWFQDGYYPWEETIITSAKYNPDSDTVQITELQPNQYSNFCQPILKLNHLKDLLQYPIIFSTNIPSSNFHCIERPGENETSFEGGHVFRFSSDTYTVIEPFFYRYLYTIPNMFGGLLLRAKTSQKNWFYSRHKSLDYTLTVNYDLGSIRATFNSVEFYNYDRDSHQTIIFNLTTHQTTKYQGLQPVDFPEIPYNSQYICVGEWYLTQKLLICDNIPHQLLSFTIMPIKIKKISYTPKTISIPLSRIHFSLFSRIQSHLFDPIIQFFENAANKIAVYLIQFFRSLLRKLISWILSIIDFGNILLILIYIFISFRRKNFDVYFKGYLFFAILYNVYF